MTVSATIPRILLQIAVAKRQAISNCNGGQGEIDTNRRTIYLLKVQLSQESKVFSATKCIFSGTRAKHVNKKNGRQRVVKLNGDSPEIVRLGIFMILIVGFKVFQKGGITVNELIGDSNK